MLPGRISQRFSFWRNRELFDAAVILSIAVLAAGATIYADGFGSFCEVLLTKEDLYLDSAATGLLFLAMATAVFGIRRTIDQRRERARRVLAERRARALALYDPLTRLPNRVHLEHELAAALNIHCEKGVTLVLVKLKGYQALNDLYGYAGGDAALAQVASRLRDRVGTQGLLARMGDDEFAVCLDAPNQETGPRLAQALLQSLEDPVQIGIEEQILEATVGVASSAGEELSCDELLRRAHVALYRANGSGSSYCYFDAEMDAYMRERSLLGKELRAAIGTDALHPEYQPIVDLNSGRIVSFEALARWTHPKQGPIPPDVFIAMAEDLGLIDAITSRLLEQACRDATAWRDSISLSFNISPTQLREGSFPLALMAILGRTGLPPHRLEVEVTESALIQDLSAARKTLSDLRAAGIRIVMDDFGKGFSSLYHLRELRFDKLKIDASFVRHITEDDGDLAIIRAIAGMSQGLGLIVTAEGIESCRQVRALMEHGIQQGQGYVFGHPMPAGEARRLISATGRELNVA